MRVDALESKSQIQVGYPFLYAMLIVTMLDFCLLLCLNLRGLLNH